MANMIKRSINCLMLLSLCGIIKIGQGSMMIYREMWNALPVKENESNRKKPFNWIILHESGGANCNCLDECTVRLKELQLKDLEDKGDIEYNFLIGGDGLIYEGRGWYKNSLSIPEYDSESISIAFIGTFSEEFVTISAWEAFKSLLKFAEVYRFVNRNYKLVAHRQFTVIPKVYPIYQAHCPGNNLFNLLHTISHWANETIILYR